MSEIAIFPAGLERSRLGTTQLHLSDAMREGGLKALDEPNIARRLTTCDRCCSEITKRISAIHEEKNV
jgi:hypothetical protein